MVIASHRRLNKKVLQRSSPSVTVLLGAVTALAILFLLVWGNNNNINSPHHKEMSRTEANQETKHAESATTNNKKSIVIESGTVDETVAYYYCRGERSVHHSDGKITPDHHLVLLHGSRFTKEDWKTSGILELFCHSSISVTALDLSVSSKTTHGDLFRILDALQASGNIVSLPIAGLVTPSASGRAVIDGVTSGSIKKLTTAVERWIPVACNSLLSLSDGQKSTFSTAKSWPILAVYGNRDEAGQRSSNFLQKVCGAKVKELNGRHPCYLDSPHEFVETVVQFLKQ